mmetsp:Transcript_21800/g.70245  ORF Transcript_21800/g.70245 Transcript_21800/m.70245 type:complete len:257 (+) Transcript_21800:207-977(+)
MLVGALRQIVQLVAALLVVSQPRGGRCRAHSSWPRTAGQIVAVDALLAPRRAVDAWLVVGIVKARRLAHDRVAQPAGVITAVLSRARRAAHEASPHGEGTISLTVNGTSIARRAQPCHATCSCTCTCLLHACGVSVRPYDILQVLQRLNVLAAPRRERRGSHHTRGAKGKVVSDGKDGAVAAACALELTRPVKWRGQHQVWSKPQDRLIIQRLPRRRRSLVRRCHLLDLAATNERAAGTRLKGLHGERQPPKLPKA